MYFIITKMFSDLVPASSMSEKSSNCTTPDFVRDMLLCTIQNNFLNCPFLNATATPSKCQEMKKFIESDKTCGWKNGEAFILDFRFWLFHKTGSENSTSTEESTAV